MTPAQIASLLILGLVLVFAIWRRINIGVLVLAAAFVVVLISGTDPKAMYEHFPGDIVVLIVGVSLLFGHLERSGALGWFVERVFTVVGDRTAMLPWVTFLIAAGLSTVGAFSTAVIALLVPTIAHITTRFTKSFYICELAAVIAANCAGLSPLNPTGATVATIADKAGVSYSVWTVWLVSVVAAAVVVGVLQVIVGRQTARGKMAVVTPAPATQHDDDDAPARRSYAIVSAIALVVFVLLVIVAHTDVGLTAMFLVVVLQLLFRPKESALFARVPWTSVLLLAGLLTYLGLLHDIGTMDAIEQAFSHIGSGALLVIVLAYTTALLCNIESSTLGVLGLMMPLVFSSFGGDPALVWVVAAVAVPAALMVMNPIHVAGTLIIGASAEEDQPVLFRRLLITAVSLALITPGLLAIVPAALVA